MLKSAAQVQEGAWTYTLDHMKTKRDSDEEVVQDGELHTNLFWEGV
jgi:hypothetical protein